MKLRTSEIFERAYSSARKLAAAETGLPLKGFPANSPFSFEQAVDETFWPGRDLADRS